MAFFRRNLNLDHAQFRRAEKQAAAQGVSVNQFVRDAIERHNNGTDLSGHLSATRDQLEQLVDEVRLEHIQLRQDLKHDVAQWRASLQTDQAQAIERYEEALKRVLHAMSGPSTPGSAAAPPLCARPMTAPRP